MSESKVFPVYGIKAITLINRSTGKPHGRYRVLGGAELNVSADKVSLMGGASRWPWATEYGAYSDAEITMTVREYPEFGFRYIAQGSSVIATAETSGNVGTLTNKSGTSAFNATVGIATVNVVEASKSAVKTGRFVVEAVGTGTVDVYYIGSQYDSYENDVLKITSSPLAIANGASTVITGWGIALSGGSGVAMNVGDTMYVDVRKVNTGAEEITVGRSVESVQEFEAWIISEDQKTGDQFRIWIPRCSASGLPVSMTEKEMSETEITLSIDYDSTLDTAYKIYKVKG